MKKEKPTHLFLFFTGNPHDDGTFEPAIMAMGHFVFDIEAGTSDGSFIIRADDGSFIMIGKMVDGSIFDFEANIFDANVNLKTIKGTNPFGDVIGVRTDTGEFPPLDEPFETVIPNLFGVISISPPPR